MLRNKALWLTGWACWGLWLATPAAWAQNPPTTDNVDRQCERRCNDAARAVFDDCRLHGGDREECHRQSNDVRKRCVTACHAPSPCQRRCRDAADAIAFGCKLLTGGTADCDAEGNAFLQECLERRCANPPGCQERCATAAWTDYHACLRQNISPRLCEDRTRQALRQCIATNCDETTCQERCARAADEARDACLELDGSQDQCDALRARINERCLANNCPNRPGCGERCVHLARTQYEECVAGGGGKRECARRARHALSECLDANCNIPPDCEERCVGRAKTAKEACEELGGGADECNEVARHVYKRCVLTHCKDPVDCEEQCVHAAQRQYLACVEEGHDPADCAKRARERLRNCIEETCAQPPPCEVECRSRAQEAYNDCIANGGRERECRRKQTQTHERCVREECSRRCGGIAGEPCDDGAFCRFRPGECHVQDNVGVCVDVPDACPEVYQPVCGCDGQTYSNECFAAMAGVSIDHRGPCRERCGGIAGFVCEDEDDFCKFPAGTCDIVDNMGECTSVPEACPQIFNPVCGCDGVTYANECEADRAGTQIDHRGRCKEVCGGIIGKGCDEAEFCKLPPGTCDSADLQGVCIEMPDACPLIYDPVCGCDGKTYGNRCLADMAGTQIDHRGPCEQACDPENDLCPDGHFCRLEPGVCHTSDTLGICTPKPNGCPDVRDPVCGCDGRTYSNRCEAAAAGVSIAHAGRCED